MAQMGFLINSAECTGCKACELACKDVHSFDVGPRAFAACARGVRRRLEPGRPGAWAPSGVFSYSVSYCAATA
ncbi:MAG: hypothetical protein ACLSDQ_02415 [Adlercreutzia equolifaciens]